MACDISKGRTTIPCKDDISGLKAIYVTNYGDYVFTTSSTSAGHLLTGLPAGITTSNTFKFELKNSGNTFNQDITSSRDNNTTIFTQTLNFVLPRLSPELEYQIKMLAYGRPQIFVEANNGAMILLGEKFGCEITGKSEIQGTMDALNGYSMTAVAVEQNPVWFLTASASIAIKLLASTQSVDDNNNLIPIDFSETTPLNDVSGIFAIQSNDKVIIYNGAGFTGTADILIRINPDGTLDNTFDASGSYISSPFNIKLQADGKLLVCNDDIAVRLNQDGSQDIYFDTTISSGWQDVHPITNNSFIYNTSSTIEKVNTFSGTYSLDYSFGVDGIVTNLTISFNSVVKQSDDKLLFSISATSSIMVNGGTFSKGPGVYRLNTDGSFDGTFNYSVGASYSSWIPQNEIFLQSDDKVLIRIYDILDTGDWKLLRLNTDGSLDNTFNVNIIGFNWITGILDINIQDSGKLVISGFDTDYETYQIIRLNIDGSLDLSFNNYPFYSGYTFATKNYSNNDMLAISNNIGESNITRLDVDGNEKLYITN
jgi:uncharacterized delta-60 repeat protein